MPGIYGYIKKSSTENHLQHMTQRLNYMSSFKKDDDYTDDYIEASHVHIGHMKEDSEIFLKEGVYISIEGEKYNDREVVFEEVLFKAYKAGKLSQVLKETDGYFNALIYDRNLKKAYLISDRYGMRMMYYYFKEGRFAWAGEVKGLLGLDFVDTGIDKRQIECFMDLGYLLEDNTLHEHIKLIKPASILEFDIDRAMLSHKYYWKWSEVLPSDRSFDESVNRLGELFLKAVDKRFSSNQEIGMSLSGGLDSRAILAAVHTLHPNFSGYAYTFGMHNSDDIEIAQKAVSKTKWEHEQFYFDSNWFYSRIDKVMNTDGMLNLMHMHGSEFFDEVSKKIDYSLNGYAGDIVLGGGWFNRIAMNTRATQRHLETFYKQHTKFCFIEDDFYDIDHIEPHLYMNRVRRFTNMGTVNLLNKVDQRKPFFDNDLIEFVYSIPDDYRKDNKLYSAMLLKFFPEFFKEIPWQKTGKTIDKPYKNNKFTNTVNRIKSVPYRYGFLKDTKSFTDYKGWIKQKDISIYLNKILDRDNANYARYVESDFRKDWLTPHLNSIHFKDNSEKILRAATLEIYLSRYSLIR